MGLSSSQKLRAVRWLLILCCLGCAPPALVVAAPVSGDEQAWFVLQKPNGNQDVLFCEARLAREGKQFCWINQTVRPAEGKRK